MASNTPNLNLLKKDPLTDGNDTFNIQTMLNDNWDKIDTAVQNVQEELDHVSVPSASTTQAGIVQLTNATNSTSETLAPTAKALKSVSDATLPKTGGTVTGALNISDPNAIPLSLHRPGNKRWVSHLEAPSSSGNTGGRLHVSPSKTVDATDWDFDKGLSINADNGRVNVKNGIEGGDLVVYNGRTWLGAQTNLGGSPSYTLSTGDSDTGLNWFGDGGVDFYSNGGKAAALHNGTFKYYDNDGSAKVLKDEINSLKQSGVDRKQQLVSAIIANGGSASTGEDMSVLINKLSSIAITRYKEATVVRNSPNENYLIIPGGFNKKVMAHYGNSFFPTPNIGVFTLASNSSVVIYAVDADGRQVDVITDTIAGRSYQLFGVGAEPGYVWINWKDSSQNQLTTWRRITANGFRINGGVRFGVRMTGTVNYTSATSGNFDCWGG